MKILVAGSSGLIGTALGSAIKAIGSQLFKLKRVTKASDPKTIAWDPASGKLCKEALEGFDVIVNLAGESIFGWWTAAKKKRIADSRILSTRLLAETMVALKSPPRLFINASAVGYYGNVRHASVYEESPPGQGFLAEVCAGWEAATAPAANAGIRTAIVRLGMVLSPQGGALKSMLVPFKLGVGGSIGSGEQWMSWIAIEDVIAALFHIMQHESCAGVYNLVASGCVSNAAFSVALAKALHRTARWRLPAGLVRLLLGEMGEALLLSGAYVVPKRLLDSNYRFMYPRLDGALEHLLNNPF